MRLLFWHSAFRHCGLDPQSHTHFRLWVKPAMTGLLLDKYVLITKRYTHKKLGGGKPLPYIEVQYEHMYTSTNNPVGRGHKNIASL